MKNAFAQCSLLLALFGGLIVLPAYADRLADKAALQDMIRRQLGIRTPSQTTPPQPQVPDPRAARNAPPAFQPGRFEGPPRWSFDTDFAADIARLWAFSSGSAKDRNVRVGGDPQGILKLYALIATGQHTITFRDFKQNLNVPGDLLECEYRRNERSSAEAEGEKKGYKPESIKMWFWRSGARQKLNAEMMGVYQRRSDHIADVELDACPSDFASALSAGFGEASWLDTTQAALKAHDAQVQENYATGFYNPVDYTGWDKNPKTLPLAEDRALAREMDKVIAGLEAQGKFPKSTPYYIALNQQLQPAMAKLAASGLAQARAIPKGEAGRKSFEQWDAGIGFTVMSLSMRVHRWGQPGNLFMEVLDTYRDLYAAQFADKGALDRKYFAQMLDSIAKYKAAGGEALPESLTTPDTQRSYGVLVMRPRQSALYHMVDKGAKVVQAYGEGRAKVEAYLNIMEQELRETRESFWACYARRCPEGGVLYYRFGALVNNLDRFLISRSALEGTFSKMGGGAQTGQTMLQLMGMNREVNTQYVGACDWRYERFLGKFTNWLSLDASSMRRDLEAALNSEEYLAVQQCRDQMEFIMRPRPQKPGLL